MYIEIATQNIKVDASFLARHAPHPLQKLTSSSGTWLHWNHGATPWSTHCGKVLSCCWKFNDAGMPNAQLAMTHRIRDWYRRQPRWVQTTNALILLLFALGLPVTLMRSGFEFKAIAWHCRHGNSITVNGVTFPVYFWYAPENTRDRFYVFDQPGPLRPTSDTFSTFTVDGRRNKDDVGTPHELAQRMVDQYVGRGYGGVSSTQWMIRSQNIECMQEHDDHLSGWVVFCYGDGPIYSVFFTGNDESLDRLKQTLADAK
jgi:hypothetical protein